MTGMDAKAAYVAAMRTIARAVPAGRADQVGPGGRWRLWLRSLPAIYDLDGLVALDLPWWTLDATERVATFLEGRPEAQVFEWGSGASTLWLAKRAAGVVSIEHDPEWAQSMRRRVPGNVELRTVAPRSDLAAEPVLSHKAGFEDLDFREYVHSITTTSQIYDLIVIDGRAREACLPLAIDRLHPDGLIVFDNVDRRRYREAIEREQGRLNARITRGLTPSLPYPTRTALLSRRSVGPIRPR